MRLPPFLALQANASSALDISLCNVTTMDSRGGYERRVVPVYCESVVHSDEEKVRRKSHPF